MSLQTTFPPAGSRSAIEYQYQGKPALGKLNRTAPADALELLNLTISVPSSEVKAEGTSDTGAISMNLKHPIRSTAVIWPVSLLFSPRPAPTSPRSVTCRREIQNAPHDCSESDEDIYPGQSHLTRAAAQMRHLDKLPRLAPLPEPRSSTAIGPPHGAGSVV